MCEEIYLGICYICYWYTYKDRVGVGWSIYIEEMKELRSLGAEKI